MSNGTNTPFGLQAIQSNIGNGGTQKLTAYTIYHTVGNVGAPLPIFSGDPVVWAPAQLAGPNVNPSAGTIIPAYTAVAGEAAARNNINTAGNAIGGILGIFVSCTYVSAQTNLVIQQVPYYPGAAAVAPGTSIIAYINDDPEVIFQVQVSSSLANTNGIIYQTSWNGLNAKLQIGGVPFNPNDNGYAQNIPNPPNMFRGNTLNGISSYYLDGNTAVAPASTAGGLLANALFDVKIIGLAGQPQGVGTATIGTPAPVVVGTTPFVNVLCRFNNHVFSAGTVSVFNLE